MSIDRGMDKEDVVHIYNGIYSAIKRNEIMSFMTTWKDPEGIMLSEISQRKTTLYDLAYMWNLKKTKQNKTKTSSLLQKTDRWFSEVGRGGVDNR